MSHEKIQERLSQLTLIKENLATNLNNLNVPSSKNEPWEDLVEKVNKISNDSETLKQLIERTVTEINNEECTIVGDETFDSCSLLTSINLPNVTSVGIYSFYGTNIETIYLPKLQTAAEGAFEYIEALTTIDCPNLVSADGEAFNYNENLVSINLPKLETLGENAFSPECTSLEEVYLPSLIEMGSDVFSGCTALKSAHCPKLKIISGYAFKGCTSLTSIQFESVEEIYAGAFQGCTALQSVTFGSSLNIVGSISFYNCSALTSFTIDSSKMVTLAHTDAFTGTPIASGTGYIYVPADLVDTYKTDSVWSTYANQILPIEE